MDIHFINLKEVDYNLQLEVRNWRNSSEIANFFQIEYIDLETHNNWLESLKRKDPKNIAFLIKVGANIVGLAYFSKIDNINQTAEWGIFIKKEFLGQGIGFYVEYEMHEIAFNRLNLFKLNISILENNKSVIKMHQKFGYKIDGIMRKNISKNDTRLDVYLMSIMNSEWSSIKHKFAEIVHRKNKYKN